MDPNSPPRLRDLADAASELEHLQNPLDFIAADHMREREVCAMIDELILKGPKSSDDREVVASFLTFHLPEHLADEEVDLFPLMLKRCETEDEIQTVIQRLRSDHDHAFSDTPTIVRLLGDGDGPKSTFSESARTQLASFAAHARRHLIVENAIVLPIARARLTADDLVGMKRNMRQRRMKSDSDEVSLC